LKFFRKLQILYLGSTLFLNGCGNQGFMTSIAQDTGLKKILENRNKKPLNYAKVRNIPYASMSAQLGDNPQTVLILANVSGNEQQWHSANHEMLVFNHGQINRTFGLSNDLQQVIYQQGFNPLKRPLSSINAQATSKGIISFSSDQKSAIPFSTQFERVAFETIAVAGNKYNLLKFKQTLDVPQLDWHVTNFFWIDPRDNQVLKAIQNTAPGLEPITIEIIKPYVQATT
jgi:hypothetical protein